jgi:hypothetical protein
MPSEKVTVRPAHMEEGPIMADGVGLTVTVVVTVQKPAMV